MMLGTIGPMRQTKYGLKLKALQVLIVLLAFAEGSDDCGSDPDPGYFYYFAYGSNLLSSRMHINCPTARHCSTARLNRWRLDFNKLPALHRWNGAVATIVEDIEADVVGKLWQISDKESDKLDQQEGVTKRWYKKINVTVNLPTGALVTARTYVMTKQPEKTRPEDIPQERQPSRTYLQVILFGAIECHIPVAHIEYIQRFPHNGRIATNNTRKSLGYPFYDVTFN